MGQERPALDVRRIREDFPILHTQMHGKPLVYLDNAATSQKPRQVIERLQRYYSAENANIHRGVYDLSQRATAEYDMARRKVQRFINAAHAHEVIFTRGTTEGINLVAQTYGRQVLKAGDEVLISSMEHHSNIVPWQMLCQQTGAKLRVIPINGSGQLLFDEYVKLLNERTRLVSIVHLSNVLGTINPVKHMIEVAHERGIPVLIDGAQWAPHGPTDVQDLDADFYAFSGHKLYGPTGIGVLYGRSKRLEAMPPYQGGGDMISSVSFEGTTYAELPHKFEAGTPNIAGAIGLGTAIDYVQSVGFDRIVPYEQELLQYATQQLELIPGLRTLGHAACRAGAISFVMENPPIASMDIGAALDREGIAVRTGHHCCQPLMGRMGVQSTARASVSFYNTREEIDHLASALRKLQQKTAATATRAKAAAPAPAVAAAATAPAGESAAIAWPQPAAASPAQAADELAGTFEFLGDWEQRDQFLLEMGEKLPALPESFRTENTRVRGCMSTVHMVGRQRPGTPDALDILADSDAHLVRGLIAVLQQVYSGQRAGEILAFDIESFLRRIGLDKHLSMGRRSGLAGMIQRIKSLAARLAAERALNVEQQL